MWTSLPRLSSGRATTRSPTLACLRVPGPWPTTSPTNSCPITTLLVRSHEVGVAHLLDDVGDVVAAVAGMQVGSADAGALDVDEQVALARHGIGHVGHLELRVLADDGLHDAPSGRRVAIERYSRHAVSGRMAPMTSRWTADQIPDQSGRTALVTGANSGLGTRDGHGAGPGRRDGADGLPEPREGCGCSRPDSCSSPARPGGGGGAGPRAAWSPCGSSRTRSTSTPSTCW